MARVSRNYNDTYDMPTGTVTFKDGDIVLGTAEVGTDVTKPDLAFYSVRSLSAGDHQITAEYNGNRTFKGSTSAPLTQTITAEAASATEHPTVTKVTSYLNPSKYGNAVTFYVRAETKPQISRDIAGSVILMDGDTELATLAMWPDGVANGVAKAYFTTSDLSVGDHPITAKYYGDARHGVADSTSEVMVQVVQAVAHRPIHQQYQVATQLHPVQQQVRVQVRPQPLLLLLNRKNQLYQEQQRSSQARRNNPRITRIPTIFSEAG